MKLRCAGPVALLAMVLCLAFAALAEAKRPRCNGQRNLCSRTFDEVVLAGTHNAMAAESMGWKRPNQLVAIPEQLDGGIRALLIDTHYGRLQPDGSVVTDDDGTETEGVRGLYLCHKFCELGATKLAPVLRSIRKWLRHNPRNVLMIENEDYIKSSDFAAAMERSRLLDHVYRGAAGPRWPPLRRMIRKRQQVVMLADRDAKGDPPWYHPTYEGILQETPYTFRRPRELTDPANWPASCQPNRGGTSGSLFLMNHWSPPAQPSEPDLETAAKVNAWRVIVGRAVECAELRGQLPSVVAVDQFTAGGLLRAVRELNRLTP